MCDPVSLSLTGAALLGTAYGASRIKKDKKKTSAQINTINQTAQNQITKNKIANSVQSTEPATQATQEAVKKLTTQKVPLNTSNTGATIGSQSSVGLNLGGY